MSRPQLWLLVGGNGAGKTTFYRISGLSQFPFVNADRIARRLRPDAPDLVVREAAREAERLRNRYIELQLSFCAETVFSHPSKLNLLRRAKRRGYELNLVYIHLPRELHVARVVQRTSEGGHDVPAEKIVPRVLRLREHVKKALTICDAALLYDNSDSDRPFELVMSVESGRVTEHLTPPRSWALELISELTAN